MTKHVVFIYLSPITYMSPYIHIHMYISPGTWRVHSSSQDLMANNQTVLVKAIFVKYRMISDTRTSRIQACVFELHHTELLLRPQPDVTSSGNIHPRPLESLLARTR